MKKIYKTLFSVSLIALMPAIAGAAGTYYNGDLYQSSRNSNQGYYSRYGSASGSYSAKKASRSAYGQQQKKAKKSSSAKQGFVFDAGLSHEFGKWEFDMNKAGSKLHYDNLSWNVITGQGAYYFGGDTPMQIKLGARYGKQYGETSMIDDDISTGKIFSLYDDYLYGYEDPVSIFSGTPAMSVGTSKGGTQMGFNVGIGLTDFFKMGNMKVTPSVGYRYFKHELKTSKNTGLSVEVLHTPGVAIAYNCVNSYKDEVQCSPAIGFFSDFNEDWEPKNIIYSGMSPVKYKDGQIVPMTENDPESEFVGYLYYNELTKYFDTGGTYYYEQAGTSHKYETVWAGPYLALDMEYQITDNNLITMGVELGLPSYTSEGVQPYRFDWKQSPSVKDEGDIGDAYHLGFNMNWSTAISDKMMFNLGFTYDYYTVSDAKANTYWADGEVQVDDSEVNSVYKSLGIHAGLGVKF